MSSWKEFNDLYTHGKYDIRLEDGKEEYGVFYCYNLFLLFDDSSDKLKYTINPKDVVMIREAL